VNMSRGEGGKRAYRRDGRPSRPQGGEPQHGAGGDAARRRHPLSWRRGAGGSGGDGFGWTRWSSDSEPLRRG
jgi:hypothetical protein